MSLEEVILASLLSIVGGAFGVWVWMSYDLW